MFRKILLFGLFVLLITSTHGQVLRIENGISLSKFTNKRFELLNDNIERYALSLGINYLESEYWFLSSEFGYNEIGGKERHFPLISGEAITINETKKYLVLNTLINVKYEIDNYSFFAGVGPTVNFLIDNRWMNNENFTEYKYNNCFLGIKPTIGFYYSLGTNYLVGMNFSYTIGLTNTAKTKYLKQYSRIMNLSFTVGYKFKKSGS